MRPGLADTVSRLASHPTLAHTLGVNDFFVHAVRFRPDADLIGGKSESGTAADSRMRIRPDSSATYSEAGRELSFWFEHNRATETLTTLANKADHYREITMLAAPRPVLFERPDAPREVHRHEHLAGRHLPFPLATTHTAISPTPPPPSGPNCIGLAEYGSSMFGPNLQVALSPRGHPPDAR